MRKQLHSIIAVAIAVVCISSCDSADRISEKTISSLLTQELAKEGDLYINARIKTGYYEENDDEARYQLRKLAAAGVINYQIERVQKQTRYKSGYTLDRSTYRIVDTYSTVTRDYYFVTVSLTEKGQALAQLDRAPYDEEEDNLLLPVDRGQFPEDTVTMVEVFPWNEPEQSSAAEERESSQSSTPGAQTEPKTEYEKAKSRENSKNEYVKAYKVKVVSARNIIVRDGKAHADYILEAYDVTPAGRIFNSVYEGRHTIGEADFIYYQDKGWILSDNETHTYFF